MQQFEMDVRTNVVDVLRKLLRASDKYLTDKSWLGCVSYHHHVSTSETLQDMLSHIMDWSFNLVRGIRDDARELHNEIPPLPMSQYRGSLCVTVRMMVLLPVLYALLNELLTKPAERLPDYYDMLSTILAESHNILTKYESSVGTMTRVNHIIERVIDLGR